MKTFAIPSVPAAPRAGFDRIVNAVIDFFDHKRSEHEISKLSPHMMRDIGLTPPPEDPLDEIMRKVRTQW